MLDQDTTYKADPSVERYLYHLTMLIAEWERDHQKEILRTNGSSTHVVPSNKQGGKSQATSSDTIDGAIQCEGCGRKGHLRSNCIYKTHPDFNHTGVWKDCKAYREVQEFFLRKGRKIEFPFLPKTKRANGSDQQPATMLTPQPTPHSGTTTPATQPAHGGRGNGGRGSQGNGGKYGPGKGGKVHFKDTGK